MTIPRTGRPAPEGAPTSLTRPLTGVLTALLAITALTAAAGCTAISHGDSGADDDVVQSPSAEGDEGPLSGQTIVIDPGHNGGNADAAGEINESVPAGPNKKACDTVGATSADGYPEHEFTWEFARDLRTALEADGATVILTRPDNEGVGPCINERAEIGNDADADAAISIHADGADSEGRGFHVIAPGEVEGYTEDIVEPSRRLAEDVRAEIRDGTDQPYADYIGEEGLDVRTDLGGLNLSAVPKIFLEVGNLGNAEDAELLQDQEWRQQTAEAVAAGKSRFLLGE
ncbi:N-acetylmuramoyl-L-alanine amidase [Lipingzhangella halophila]|uniref:N-acetylmuramoyl-L-alanine amidase n=1 Tax=Lipingzhangella halophila TaxID=1783352 RepID=A0A7W7RLI0_9ACTN|nr:N-acetylmuramoyl-L-alanine amidase [Lipingzhangella halophila]MBB4934195.1 N-acetylmuramoyl-L-alanine amidase [Lipingzhangella halophila]